MNIKKRSLLALLLLNILLLTGCSNNISATEGETNDINNVIESNTQRNKEECFIPETTETENIYILPEDTWGEQYIKEWIEAFGGEQGRYMSTDPLNDAYSSLMREAGYSSAEFERHIENAERLILEIPDNADSATEILFFSEGSEQLFFGVDWEKYQFTDCDCTIIGGCYAWFRGYAYLSNEHDDWKDQKPALFISFLYLYETEQLEIIEVVESKEEYVDYKTILYYERDEEPNRIVQERGLRLLDRTRNVPQEAELMPVTGLEGEELSQYIEIIFLDYIRYPDQLDMFRHIFTEDTTLLLNTLKPYYEKPYEIYDYANVTFTSETTGTVWIDSQFQPTSWHYFMLSIEFDFLYEKETGQIEVKGGEWCIYEKP